MQWCWSSLSHNFVHYLSCDQAWFFSALVHFYMWVTGMIFALFNGFGVTPLNNPCSTQLFHLIYSPHTNYGCIPLGWSGSGSVIQNHLDHGASKEPMNPCPEWIHRFLWCSMIRVILDHWSWSSQRNAPYIFSWNKYICQPNKRCSFYNFWVTSPQTTPLQRVQL